LDGVVYKLVPIKTPINKRSPFDMGRIDADKMYDIVMSWDWGNSGSPDIYHDTETRRNGITYRSNLARLAEALINNDENGKAEKVLDRKSTRLNSSHVKISYAVFCLKKKN